MNVKRLMIFAIVTLLVIIVFLALYYDLRESIFADTRLPYSVESARGLFSMPGWC